MKHAAKPFAHIQLIPATHRQEPILANLLELYMHDFSDFLDLEIGPDGRFGYSQLPLYWSEPDRHPFLVQINGKLAGLVFVSRASDLSRNEPVWDMAEFFILRRYRRHGIGTQIAHQVWRRFPGPWQVRVMQSNTAAHHFWAHAISSFTGELTHPVRFEKDGNSWERFSFESRPGT
jgi:predicted acetyltransferase